ncbi:MAG: glycine dehydrogenase subunit 2 [Dehalococcoidia bacterium]|nr:glycine dehydrogenase subunit 2 [Dehalococcoidia bacterium]
MDVSVAGRRASTTPSMDVPLSDMPPAELLRDDLHFPEVSEPQLIRYFTHLSTLNYGVDSGIYPLGSCTMKYNPKLHEDAVRLPGFANVHPIQPDETAQGALQLMHNLQTYLAEITGTSAVSLAPLAGAHGEFTGLQMFRAYHLEHGQIQRKRVLIPDSAHGTNPATAAMLGFTVTSVATDNDGNVDMDALHKELGTDVVGLMITLPSTLGLFERHIVEICKAVHEAGGLVYGDGANMNALLGQVKPGALGFDVVHLNLHKTFSTPHGGGGPGSGPVCVSETLRDYLPDAVVVKIANNTYKFHRPAKSIGKIAAFNGNFGMLVRAYAYIRILGAEGLKSISENAVINANYVLAKLKGDYLLPYQRLCMHEVIFSAKRQKEHNVRALDVAKRLIDYGFHPPTMYFPLIVEEALMIEPTESEGREGLDAFIDAMLSIAREVEEQPELVRNAPYSAPMTRLDEARAARQPVLRWRADADKQKI